MKPTYKMIVMMICFSVIALIAAACNAPKTAPTPTAVPVSNIEEQQNI